MKKNNHISFIALPIMLLLPLMAFTQVLFQTGQSFSTGGSWFEVVAIGDVNNDAREDIVAATGVYFSPQYDYQLVVYLQSDQGTFPTTAYYPYSNVYPGIRAIAVKDVNNDLLKDVVIGYGDSIGIFFQNTSHTLNPQVSFYSGNTVDDIKVGDVNNDNLPDIVACHWNDGFIRVFYQAQTGFTTKTYAKPSAGYDEIEIGDVNSDGLNDVVFMAGQGSGGIHVFKQNGGGTLNNYISYFPGGGGFQSLNGIAISDLNNDGANDVVATRGGNMPDASVVFWYQDPLTKLLKPAVSTPAYEIPEDIRVADFNCDGKPEIFINHGGWDAVTVWSADSTNHYTSYDIYQVPVAQHPKPEALAAGDINNDGKLDIVTVGNATTIQLLYNVSTPTSFTNVLTSVESDTVYTNESSFTYFYTSTDIDTIPGYLIIQTDSFQVNYSSRQDSIKTDSVYTRTGSLCDSLYTDVVTSTHYTYLDFENRDTSFWSNTIDTMLVSDIQEPFTAAISVSPNPFFTQITFHCATNEPIMASIYDGLGQQILQQVFTNSATINTTQFSAGIYFYALRNAKGGLKTGKIVKR